SGVEFDDTLTFSYDHPHEYGAGNVTLSAGFATKETGAANIVYGSGTGTATVDVENSGFNFGITPEQQSFSGNEDERIALPISGAGLVDTDGSESVVSAVLKNVPADFLVY